MNRTRLIAASAAFVVLVTGGVGIANAAGHRHGNGRPVVLPTSVSTQPDIPVVAGGTSLAEAASKPHGVGARDVKPRGKPMGPFAVPSDQKQNRKEKDGAVISINGCLVGYGAAGECLPAVPGSAAEMGMTRAQMPWTCQEVQLTFPDGIKVVSKKADVLKLDSNHDGTACGPGDK